MLVLQ